MTEFWQMGGYAAYVWSSYALAAVVLGWNVFSALRSHREALQRAERLLAMADSDTRNQV